MKFHEFPYQRPSLEKVEKDFLQCVTQFKEASDLEAAIEVIQQINALRTEFETQREIAMIRMTIDTTDEFYQAEQDYFDEVSPIYENLLWQYSLALVNSPLRSALEEKYGQQLFRLADMAIKGFHPSIIELLQQENRLTTEYQKLMASAKIPFEGEERTLSQMTPFVQDKDRTMRKNASLAVTGFMHEHEEEIDRIYDDLVKLRTKIAKKLGFSNFVELGYVRMNRMDYNAKMVEGYREAVKRYLVPIATKLRERQKQRLGLDTLYYYDESINFTNGNAVPQGNPDWILEQGKTMYDELSPETKAFFSFMVEHELLDLVSKKGKSGGGYCTYIPGYQAPFIFSNFNGTSGDVDVLTHEAGHAFQVFTSKSQPLPEYYWPTYESAEIFSMSMEFLTWPWMNLFFKEQEQKYKFSHLSGSLLFVPYGVCVDAFQHYVYENPDASPAERKQAWRQLEKEFLPHRDYEDNAYFEQGAFWHRQSHIFMSPFYYIDYTLAQICAFQFWQKAEQDRPKAWQDYLRICQAGGSKSFLELVELADLSSPFEASTMATTMAPVEAYLASIDDLAL